MKVYRLSLGDNNPYFEQAQDDEHHQELVDHGLDQISGLYEEAMCTPICCVCKPGIVV